MYSTRNNHRHKQPRSSKQAGLFRKYRIMSSGEDLVLHRGGCHCGAVRFEVWAPRRLRVVECNCSICYIKKNDHFIVPKSRFKLLKGEEHLTIYTFNTGKAQHTFCKVCGVQSFYTPRSNQDGYGVNPRSLDDGTVEGIDWETFDGQNWEKTFATSDIRLRSKE